ncbi:gamma-glutamyltransferase [Parahaliea aestuarii]|uniref:Glutathione hydrolase proenzyme n=1 Tax=Parahaliea aestuarii TaxID=1852021 RepID=A0A5C8ZXU1_9GAMM|nr:gamma-glutamyltransferase [Parahaliea aestuarii]TXS93375.1 gamma-glutamyltransferase [Parahaliea aestuarii]
MPNCKTATHSHPLGIALIALCLLLASGASRAGTAAIAMPEPHAAEAAAAVLQEGGNAVDAAIAAAFVLAVTYPEAGNIGGGGFMLSLMDGEANFLDFRERAPAAASRDMYLNDDGRFRQQDALIGGLASGVPGTVAGLAAAHERYGSLPWKRLLRPAIDLAYRGFIVPDDLASLAEEAGAEFAGITNFASYFGQLKAGERFPQADLATTLMRIAEDPDDFYRGVIAKQILRTMQTSGGLISARDLADYRPVWRQPLQQQWRDVTVLTAPPPSSGGIALLQLLQLRDLSGQHFAGLAHNSPAYIHLLAELEKRAFADRAEYLGDPDFVEVPVTELLDEDYLASRAAGVRPNSMSSPSAVKPGLEPTETTHFSVLDGSGNAVSLTYTLNWDFGSGVVVAGGGFLLNNEMDDFSAAPGVPNAFGVIGNERNAIAPGKRMLSSMTPTILLRGGQPALVLGSPGGSTIFTSVFQVILNLEDFGMPLQAAVDATRFHHQLPEATLLRHDQREIPRATLKGLKALGYTVEPNSWGDLGDVQAIRIGADGIEAAADSRGRGAAQVLEID